MKLRQNLCPEGRKYRQAFDGMTAETPPAERYRIMQEYFWHKNYHCQECGRRWEYDADGR